MRHGVCLIALLAMSLLPPAFAAPTIAEVEDAYKKGQADWDKGDPISAMPKLKIAADGGHAVAQALLAYVLDQADNDAEAAVYYRKSAEQGNPDGMYGLASFYSTGDGDVKKDETAAREWFLRAAEAGHPQAIMIIVMSHIKGGLGFTDEERFGASAVKWYKKGAEIGNIPALERLITAYRKGELGLTIDPQEADRLQAKVYEILGVDPATLKKKRQRK